MDERVYLSTGEITKIAGITKDTLFHYEKMGLLLPEKIMDNKYRHYSFQQLELLSAIVMLKELGMPLQEIKSYLEVRNPQTFMELLSKEEKVILRKMESLKKTRKWIIQQKKKIKHSQEIEPDTVAVVYQPEKYYILDKAEDSQLISVSKCLGRLINAYHQQEKNRTYEVEYIQERTAIQQGVFTAYQEVALSTQTKPRLMPYVIRREGYYLTGYHTGSWREIADSYLRMEAYAKAHHLVLGEKYYEMELVNQLAAAGSEDYLIELQIEVIGTEAPQ